MSCFCLLLHPALFSKFYSLTSWWRHVLRLLCVTNTWFKTKSLNTNKIKFLSKNIYHYLYKKVTRCGDENVNWVYSEKSVLFQCTAK